MSLRAVGRTDTRALFRPLCAEWVGLLRGLSPEQWARPTAARGWDVRDVATHVLDGWLRRLSYHRDGLPLPPPERPVAGFDGLVRFIDGLNAEWVGVSRRRHSPRVLTELIESVGLQVAVFFEELELDAPAFWPVVWAGEDASPAWLDIGRDYTEAWHHQQQIREAVGAPLQTEPRWLAPLIAIGVHALPRACAAVEGAAGDALHVQITGASGGEWAVAHDGGRWRLFEGQPDAPRARVSLDEDSAWRLLFKALPRAVAERRTRRSGDARLADAVLDALALLA